MRTLILIALASGSCLFKAYAQDPFIPTVEIPAGSFYMGGTGEGEDFDEAPVHKYNAEICEELGITVPEGYEAIAD